MTSSFKISLHVDALSTIKTDTLHGKRCIENAALVCHEANRGLCLSYGDTSQKPWELASAHQRESCVDGILFLFKELQAGRDVRPGQSHERWMEYKLAAGWAVGPIKNEQKMEHPNLVPFEKLDVREQAKDHVYVAVAKAALRTFGPRFIYNLERAEEYDNIRVHWRASDPVFDLSTFTFHGGVTMLAEAASFALADAFDHPYIKRGRLVNMRIYSDVGMCIAEDDVVLAYDYLRASEYPHVTPSFNELGQLAKSHWYTIFHITKAMQQIHGVHVMERPRTWEYAGGDK